MKRLGRATIASVLLVAAGAVQAQDKKPDKPKEEPTYEETRKWVVDKIADAGYTRTWKDVQGGVEGHPLVTVYSGSYEHISMDDCRLVYSHLRTRTEQIDTTGSTSTQRDESTIPLSKVGTTEIVVIQTAWKDWKLEINAPVGTQKSVTRDETQINHNVGGEIIFGRAPATDEASANRLQKALAHAVELCKTKDEPF
ncbi:MAG: hypothetical protein WB799_24225 [Candidatus Sulfotelmatobacter sp.]